MKTNAILAVGLLLAIAGGAMGQTSQLLTEAQHAYLTGNVEASKEKFQSVLQRDPENITARNYLRMIAVTEKQGGGPGQLEKQLTSLVLAKVEFKEATFGSALEYLKQAVAKQTEGKTQVSFVVELPPEFFETKKVTLNLANIPFTEALRYVCELGGVEYRFGKYAIVIQPKMAPTPVAAQ